MEKRIIHFIVLSTLVLVGSMALQSMFAPEKQDEVAQDGTEEGEEQPGDEEGDSGEEATDPEGEGEDAAGENTAENPSGEEAPEIAPPEPAPDVPLERFTLGSLDENPNTGPAYRMLVTLNNRGAVVERIELSSHRYRDLETEGGYLGNLALSDAPSEAGAVVNVVGPGTPASRATAEGVAGGLQVGDVITALAGQEVSAAADVARILQTTKPREGIEIDVMRSEGDGASSSSLTFTAELSRQPLELIQPEGELRSEAADDHPLSFQMTLSAIGSDTTLAPDAREIAGIPSCYDSNWVGQAVDTPQGPAVEFRLPVSGTTKQGEAFAVELVRRYRLVEVDAAAEEEAEANDNEEATQAAAGPAYHLVMEVELWNRGQESLNLGYRLRGPTGLPLEGWWYAYKVHPTKWGVAGARDLYYRSEGGQHHMIRLAEVLKQYQRSQEEDEEDRETPVVDLRLDGDSDSGALNYVGVDSQYFTVAVISDPEDGDGSYNFKRALGMIVGAEDTLRGTRSDVTFQLDSAPKSIAPGAAIAQRFRIFAGPKSPPLMKEYGLNEVVVYGWFGMVARPMQGILHFLHSIVHNYGLAIILLTVLVRGALFPLGRKVAMNARKMQELAPEMKAIAEKYKDDMQKRSEAQRELFKAHNYNPFGGCLLMFLQLPIFIGLYRALSVDIELRQAPLIPGIEWASNLAGPDMLFRWDSFMGSLPFIGGMFEEGGMLGPYFNLLPMITVGLFLVQQKLFTPPPTDEQQRIQQKMMSFMTIFIGLMFFKVPAGLCLYFISSSLWGIGERKLLPKPNVPAGQEKPKQVAAVTTSSAKKTTQSSQRKGGKGKSKKR